MKRLFALCWFLFLFLQSSSQSCFPDDDDPTITLTCHVNCTNLEFTIPDIRQTTEYTVLDIPYEPLPFTDLRATAVTFTNGAWPGNSYSPLYDLPFGFCFFGSVYNSLTVGANGTVSFDAAAAEGWCDPFLKRANALFPLPNARYARALIAAVMHDLDPGDTARVSTNRKIEFRIEGTAPCRKAVISFFRVPLWPGPQRNCQASINTHQIILYESTGIIDVFIKDSPQCQGSNEGYNTVGIQNFNRDVAYSPRDKNCTQWGGSDLNLGYRFLPSGGASQLQSVKLFLGPMEIMDGEVNPGRTPGTLDVSFRNVCPRLANNTYVMRAVYENCQGTGTLELQDTVYVIKTNSLSATATSRPAECTSPTGMIMVDVPPGAGLPPIMFSLDGGPPQASNVFNNVPGGMHTVTVTDASICSDIIAIEVEVTTTLNVTTSSTITSCNRSPDGTITVDPGGGVAPISYSINGGPPQASNAFTNLAPGLYYITVTDAAGCVSANHEVEVQAGPRLTALTNKTDITCFGSADGTISVNRISAGSAPFQYSLDGITYQLSNTFTNLAAGFYIIRIRDAYGCEGEAFATINEPAELRADATGYPVLCNGESNGSIEVRPTGGTLPYTFSIDGVNFQSSNTFTVGIGTYTVTIRDRNGCRATVSNIVITEPAVLSATTVSANATCNGGNDGTITVTATGGTTSYEYSVDGNFQPSNVLQVGPGTYTVYVRDRNGCAFDIPNVVVGLTNDMTITQANDQTVCEGGTVQLQAISNATQYEWRPATGLNNPNIANPAASPTATTEYIVHATYGRCTAEDTIMVNILAAPVPDAGADGFICVGQTYQLQGTGGATYQWTPATFLSDPSIANPVVTPDRTIEYTLTVTGANGCPALQTDRVTVDVTPPIRVVTTPLDTIVHTGDQFTIKAVAGATNFLWTPSTGLSNPNIPDPVVTAGAVGDVLLYKVTASTFAGCTGEGFVKVQVFKGPDLYVPSGFTPNKDGKNDKFFPYPIGIKQLKYFQVFNRWGQMVFSTTTLGHGWDGTFGGREEASGVYVWRVEALDKENRVITKQGTVTLIR